MAPTRRPYKYTGEYYRKVVKEKLRRKAVAGAPERNLENGVPVFSAVENATLDTDKQKSPSMQPAEVSASEHHSTDTGSEDDSDSPENLSDRLDLACEIKAWMLRNQITHRAATELLRILNKSNDLRIKFPNDSRTFLSTPRTTDLVEMGTGSFFYNGLENSLRANFSDLDASISVKLACNIDGLPLCKSSKIEFWPILCGISNMPEKKVMVVAIYMGNTKPTTALFLKRFIDEVNTVIETGINIRNHKITVQSIYFICDSPARCHLKGTAYYNSYSGCMKCTVVGEYDKTDRHMSFPRLDMPLRTDSSFRQQIDSAHHREVSPLVNLPIDLVADFIIADSLHLLDLGIMKKCLMGWTRGTFKKSTKWSSAEIIKISTLLSDCNSCMPKEIHRAVRSLDCLSFWKATEYRTFLLYLGPVILKDYLEPSVFKHYLQLFCAVTICTTDEFSSVLHIADSLFKEYIEGYMHYYGWDTISSNVHNLCHVVSDVKRFGNLTKISAYPYENMLYTIKKLLRSGHRPLAQISKRLHELSFFDANTCSKINYPFVERKLKNATEKKYACIHINHGTTLINNNANKWFMTKNNEIVQMDYATRINNELVICGAQMKNITDLFTEPFNSSHLNIYKSVNGFLNSSKMYSLSSLKCKLIHLKYHEDDVFLPLLHTYKAKLNGHQQ